MNLSIDFGQCAGKIKPMNCVNNGPVWRKNSSQNISNMNEFRDAHIPYARTHDSSIDYFYGGEHIVDVNLIFTDFDADPNDPASYDFTLTDEFLDRFDYAGTKVFYRLGSKIEHWTKKYGTLPPKDFHKWAVICEHIIRHCNEGWANGAHRNIEYWEIWNEPDGAADDAKNKLTWGGTRVQFYELYTIAAKHLKEKFPSLKIGGPAVCGYNELWDFGFLEYVKSQNAPLDFFSWHGYAVKPESLVQSAENVRRLLDRYGFIKTESILNEWNYIISFEPEPYLSSIKTIIGLKGAVFSAAAMCACQDTSADMLMYYDARPCVMNGIFDFYTKKPLKGYYPFKIWSFLAELGNEAVTKTSYEDIYCVSAYGQNGKTAALVCYYTDLDEQPEKELEIEMTNRPSDTYRVLTLDEAHDFTETDEGKLENGIMKLSLKPNTAVLIL